MSKYVRDLRAAPLPAAPTSETGLLGWARAFVSAVDRLYRRLAMWLDSIDQELDTEHLTHDNQAETITAKWTFDEGFVANGSTRFTYTGAADSAWFDGVVRVKDELLLPNDHDGIVFEDEYGWGSPKTYNFTLSGGSTSLLVEASGTESDFGLPPSLQLGKGTAPVSLDLSGWLTHSGEKIGFFGATSTTKRPVADLPSATAGATYGSNEQQMLQDVHDKLNELLDALQAYGLV